MVTAISAQQLAVTFGRRAKVHALRPLDLQIEPGRIVGVLGQNGSGKTTLLRVLSGLLPATGGRVLVLGESPGSRALRRRVAYQPEGALPLGVLSAREFLAYAGACLGLHNRESDARAAAWLRRLELADTGRTAIRNFSTGMQKRLNLCAALLGEPELLLLDEPTSGLDPFGSEVVMDVLREVARQGRTVLMASHQLLEVEAICDEVLVLHRGEVRARGSLDELLGSGDRALIVRGLGDEALQRLGAECTRVGGELVRIERPRDHLFALFRRLGREQR